MERLTLAIDTSTLVLIQDTREQRGWQELFDNPCCVATLSVGDYSVAGLEHLVAIERKSLPDLLGSLTHDRQRFERELAKARAYQRFFILIEADPGDVLHGRFGRYGSNCNPKSIWESIAAFSVRYAPFIFAGSKHTAARLCESLLLKFAREQYRTVERIEQAHRQLREAS